MGPKSIQVPQPEFSNWVIKRRQELNLTPSCLREKVGGKISERTLKYIEDGKRNSFSEYTLNILASALDISYQELLAKINELKTQSSFHNKIKKSLLSHKNSLLVTFLFFFIVLVLFIFGKDIVFKNQLADVEIHSDYPHIIVAFNEKGEILWQKNIGTNVQKVAVADLNKNGKREVIAATLKHDQSDKGDEPGWFFVFNEAGELLTKHNMWKPSIYTTEEPWANIQDFQVVDLENDGTLEIVAIVRGYQYHPSRLVVLHYKDLEFVEEKSYWNPGYLIKLYIEDVNNDSLPEIICVGVNNHFKLLPEYQVSDNVYSIFMLNGTSIYGQAPPYLGNEQYEQGSEIWYRYLMPPTATYERSRIVDVTFKGETEKLIYVKAKDSCFFYLNYSGNIVDTYKGDQCTGETELLLVQKDKNGVISKFQKQNLEKSK